MAATTKLSADSPEVTAFVAAYQENRNLADTWKHQIVAEDRRRYISVDETDADDRPPYVHRSGRFLIDRATGTVYTIRGYGQRGHYAGTVEGLTASFRAGSATFQPNTRVHVETGHARVASTGASSYVCPCCGLPATYQGWFGPADGRFQRYTCDSEGCEQRGTSWPESVIKARMTERQAGLLAEVASI